MPKRIIGYIEYELDSKLNARPDMMFFNFSDDIDKKIFLKDVNAFIYKADEVGHYIVNKKNYKKYSDLTEENKKKDKELKAHKNTIKLLKEELETKRKETEFLGDNLLLD